MKRASPFGALGALGLLAAGFILVLAPEPPPIGTSPAQGEPVAFVVPPPEEEEEPPPGDRFADDAGAEAEEEDGAAAEDAESPSPCPEDMVHVATTFCPDVERRCIDLEYEPINHLPICHAFAHSQRCRLRPRPIDFCIDRYEYPDRPGAHPTWMLDWYQAQATCESKGKRLCWASEWTAACEGPDHTPFPYGWERDHDRCNMDNFYIEPKRFGPNGQFFFYARDPEVREKELARLDQSVPSGSMEECRSGFGVYDMTGNLDEWVTSDVAPRETSRWAGLKGGGWGHVRSQCRPMTFSHFPGFSYYFVGFRCCRDVPGAPRWTPAPDAVPAPEVAPNDVAAEQIPPLAHADSARRPKFTRLGKRE